MTTTFEDWFIALQQVALEMKYGKIDHDSKEAWLPFFNDGLTPKQAIEEDLESAL
jgi:hypothetical protein